MISSLDMDDFNGGFCTGEWYPLLNAIHTQFAAPLPLLTRPLVQPEERQKQEPFPTQIPSSVTTPATSTSRRLDRFTPSSPTIDANTLTTTATTTSRVFDRRFTPSAQIPKVTTEEVNPLYMYEMYLSDVFTEAAKTTEQQTKLTTTTFSSNYSTEAVKIIVPYTSTQPTHQLAQTTTFAPPLSHTPMSTERIAQDIAASNLDSRSISADTDQPSETVALSANDIRGDSVNTQGISTAKISIPLSSPVVKQTSSSQSINDTREPSKVSLSIGPSINIDTLQRQKLINDILNVFLTGKQTGISSFVPSTGQRDVQSKERLKPVLPAITL